MKLKKKDNRGRKPAEDPKECVRLWVPKSVIKKMGGVDSVREEAYLAINQKAYPIK